MFCSLCLCVSSEVLRAGGTFFSLIAGGPVSFMRLIELILGLPALLVWHFSESRSLKGLIVGKTSELDPA